MKKFFTLLFCAVAVFSFAQLPNINLVQLATGFSSPIGIANCGDNRLFVIEQAGRIRILHKDGTINATPFLILDSVRSTSNEQGLLSVAFSPNYKQDGFFYVNYIFNNGSSTGVSRISRFSVSPADSNLAVASSEQVLLTFSQPYTNHNGSMLLFGQDGYLYITQGDGGSANDPQGNGQNKNVFLGKILRIDVSNPNTTYTVPSTNPFVGQSNVKPEVWAYGLRNPWRCSFDRITGDLWIGDVGQDFYEEIDFQPASSAGGENYGWRCREGFHACPTCNVSGCASTGFTEPVFEYSHSFNQSCSVTGGYLYRGTQYNALWGKYIFADYCSGQFFSIKQIAPNVFDADTLNDLTNFQYTSFGEDNLGELYVCYRSTGTGGRIYRLTETTDCNPVAFISLQDTIAGCAPVTLFALQGDTLSYQWYDVNGAISGATSHQFATQQSGWYKVKVSKAQAGCEAFSDSVFVNVLDTTPLVKNAFDSIYCITDGNVYLSGVFNLTGGVFSGSGVTNDSIFEPALAGVGVKTIQYEYASNAGCTYHASFNFQVGDATPIIEPVIPAVDWCLEDAPFALDSFFSPAGGVYSGVGVTNNALTPAGEGNFTFYYEYTNSFGCVSRDTFSWNAVFCSVGIEDVSEEISFSIFPNPAKGNFYLEVKVSSVQHAELTITDALGRVCLRKSETLNPAQPNIAVESPQLAAGVYSVQLKTEKEKAVRSLVIE